LDNRPVKGRELLDHDVHGTAYSVATTQASSHSRNCNIGTLKTSVLSLKYALCINVTMHALHTVPLFQLEVWLPKDQFFLCQTAHQ